MKLGCQAAIAPKARSWALAGFAMFRVFLLGLVAPLAQATELRIATVNNAHMLALQSLAAEFERQNPGVRLKWTVLEESRLRQAVSVDLATGAGQFDVVTLGQIETHLWGQRGWLQPLPEPPSYEAAQLLPPVRQALSVNGRLMAGPFYAESSLTLWRRDLLASAGTSLPERPTWQQVRTAAAAAHDPANGVYGICLRGKPGWGENLALVTTMANTWGGQWFDMDWKPRLDTPAWTAALGFYVELLRTYGPPDAVANGYNENLALFQAGRCAIWVDASVAASTLLAREPALRERLAWSWAPLAEHARGHHWLWVWALAVPRTSTQSAMAQRFVLWASSRQYIEKVAARDGWAAVPPGTRLSTYAEPAYRQANPAAQLELRAILAADPARATVPPSPYLGIQLVAIPQFQAIGTAVARQIAAALTGQRSVEAALTAAQAAAERAMAEAAQSPPKPPRAP